MPHRVVAAAAAELRSNIVAARAETEAQRKLPDPMVAAFVDAQLFRLAIPSDLGGWS